jgi:tetratricopeptide (TPR) repeat protein
VVGGRFCRFADVGSARRGEPRAGQSCASGRAQRHDSSTGQRRLRSNRQDVGRALLRERQLSASGRRPPRVARLVDADAGTFALQESLTDRFANLLALQDDLARRFASALDESPAGGLKTRTSSLAAFQLVAEANDLYLTGRYKEAIDRLQRALKEDDKYADAWALLGKSHGLLATPFNSRAGMDAHHRQGLIAALRAVELNPNLYEAQVSLARVYRGLFQYELAAQAAQKAIDLNPRSPEAYEILGSLYTNIPYGPCARRPRVGRATVAESARARSELHACTPDSDRASRLVDEPTRVRSEGLHGNRATPFRSGQRSRSDARSSSHVPLAKTTRRIRGDVAPGFG